MHFCALNILLPYTNIHNSLSDTAPCRKQLLLRFRLIQLSEPDHSRYVNVAQGLRVQNAKPIDAIETSISWLRVQWLSYTKISGYIHRHNAKRLKRYGTLEG